MTPSESIPISPLRGLYQTPLLLHTTPKRLPSGSAFWLSFLANMLPSSTPWGDRNRLFQACGSDLGLRHVMSGSALPTVLQSASPRADLSLSSCSPRGRSDRLTRSKTNAAFGRPVAIGTLTAPGRFFAGPNTRSSFPINAVDCEGHLKGLGNHLPNIHQDAGLAVTAFPCRASVRAESCPKWFWAVRKIRCVVCACKG